MFLRNFWELIRCGFNLTAISTPYSGYNVDATATSIKAVDGTDLAYLLGNINTRSGACDNVTVMHAANATWKLFNDFQGVVGTGVTEPDADDYQLAGDVTSDFSSTSTSINVSVDAQGQLSIMMTWTGLNNSGSDLILREFGAVKPLYYYSSSSMYCQSVSNPNLSPKNALMIRQLLSDPITVPAGSSVNISVEITIK